MKLLRGVMQSLCLKRTVLHSQNKFRGVRSVMCGIVAFFSKRSPTSEAALLRAIRSLNHRGPDSQRHWMSPDARVALGHARLSIIDLATGEQPIASEDGRTRIVVNGEFYG